MQVLISQFWARWLRECLPTLIARKKWNQSTRNVRVGDLVLIVDEWTQREDWLLARVMKTFAGKEHTVRVCKVKTKAGLYKKPVAKLPLLEECSTWYLNTGGRLSRLTLFYVLVCIADLFRIT